MTEQAGDLKLPHTAEQSEERALVVDSTEDAAMLEQKAPEQDAETGGTPDESDTETVEDPSPAENSADEHEAETGGYSEVADVSTPPDLDDLTLNEIAENSSDTDEFVRGAEAKKLANPGDIDIEDTADEPEEGEPNIDATENVDHVEETKPADNATCVKKTRIRKKRNRKNQPARRRIVAEPPPVSVPTPPEPTPTAPNTSGLSYSAVVRPLDERGSPENASEEPTGEGGVPTMHGSVSEMEEDDDGDDSYGYDNYYDDYDYGGVQDSYSEYRY